MTLIAAPDDAGKRLDTFLHERLPEFSRSRLQSWIKAGRVTIADDRVRSSHLLRGTEAIAVEPAGLAPLQAQPEAIPLTFLYEDEDVVVVDKPAGMVVHAGAGQHEGTLVNALLHHFGTLSTLNGDVRPGIVHRLDRDTSGLIVVARTDRAHQSLATQFHDRQVEKIYLALVHGHPKTATGHITASITRDPVRRVRMTTKLGTGRSAITDYNVLETIGPYAFLQVKIGTGRTHQIRVHLASIGHPVVGDRLYGAPTSTLQRFFLHAHRLTFMSPTSGLAIAVVSPLPPELSRLLEDAREASALQESV